MLFILEKKNIRRLPVQLCKNVEVLKCFNDEYSLLIVVLKSSTLPILINKGFTLSISSNSGGFKDKKQVFLITCSLIQVIHLFTLSSLKIK